MFLNTFLQLSKKAKIDNSQALNILYEKLSDEFKDWLVTIKKAENLNDLILLLRNIDTNIKKISKQSQLRVKPNVSNFPTIKPLFMLYNSAFTKLSTVIGVTVVFSVPSIATGTHSGPIDISNMIRQGPILQNKKDRCNSLGLCYYCDQSRHIVMDHKNRALLATKKQAKSALMGNSMALVLYKPLSMEEKEMSLG